MGNLQTSSITYIGIINQTGNDCVNDMMMLGVLQNNIIKLTY